MKKYSLITTNFCKNCRLLDKQDLSRRFNYDGDLDDLFVNFSDKFSPNDISYIPNIGNSRRKDLVYGKIFLLRQFLETTILNNYEYVCHIDYNDTKFNLSYLEMMDYFSEQNIDFIISTEKNAWPYIEQLRTWSNKELDEKEFLYLNSGALISKSTKLYDYLLKLENLCLETDIDFWDDQGVWQYYDLMVESLNKDYDCKYFFSTALLDDSYYSIENTKIKTKHGNFPYLIHDNSSYSLNLINKI